jgi:hypothetical protein
MNLPYESYDPELFKLMSDALYAAWIESRA